MNGQGKRSSPGNRSSDFVVRIESNDNGDFQGNLINIQSGQNQTFRSLLEMYAFIQHKLDKHNFPRKAEEFRSWKNEVNYDRNIGGNQDGI